MDPLLPTIMSICSFISNTSKLCIFFRTPRSFVKMVHYEGIATMYMSMPMAAQSLPLLGSCTVDDKRISLKFPLTSVSFDLPDPPKEGGKNVEFKMNGPKGEMVLNITWNSDMNAFFGQGNQSGSPVLTFFFYNPTSPLKALKQL